MNCERKTGVSPRRVASAIVLCVFSAACGVSTPLHPSGVGTRDAGEASNDFLVTRNAVQRVEEGNSGGGGGDPCPSTHVCLDLGLTAGANIFDGEARGPHDPTASALDFSISGWFWPDMFNPGINQTPAGFVLGVFASAQIDLAVNHGSATVAMTLYGPFVYTRALTASGTAPAIQSQTACTTAPGDAFATRNVTTTVTLELEHLGRTTIVAFGKVRCTP